MLRDKHTKILNDPVLRQNLIEEEAKEIEDLEKFEEELQQEALDNIQMDGEQLLTIFSREEFKMMQVIG